MNRERSSSGLEKCVLQIGKATREWTVGDFAFGSWWTRDYGHRVHEHQHTLSHIMFACAGGYHSSVRGVDRAQHRIIFHPEHTVHQDRFETPGLFFSVNFNRPPEQIFGVECPRVSSLADSQLARCLVGQLMGMPSPQSAGEQLEVECRVAELMQEFSGITIDAGHPRWIERVVEALRNTDPPPRMTELARIVDVHPFHMAAVFRRIYHCTPAEYARNVRVDRALSCLYSSKMPLADVALAHGFSDQSHFTRAVTSIFGVGPAKLRRRFA